MNTPYNKAVYGTLAGALTTILFYILSLYGIVPGPEVQGAVTTVIMMLIVFLVPNQAQV